MSVQMEDDIINWKALCETRTLMGAGFVRILGYFREDGMKSVAAIEEALRTNSSAQLVMPAYTLKDEAWQFGAEKLGALAERIEIAARHYVEIHQSPSDLVEDVVQLRPMFEATLTALEDEISPLAQRRPVTNSLRSALSGSQYHGS